MAQIKVIITGATGMVGEGVLFECLQHEMVNEVLIINRKHYDLTHPKLKELIIPDFFQIDQFDHHIQGYDGCFFCAGISSVGMNEEKYTHITYDTTLTFAKAFLSFNPNSVFTYVSGRHTDSSEKGRLMWARVKGKTENELMQLGFRGQYNFRPGAMLPYEGQKNWKKAYKWIAKLIKLIAPKSILTMQQVGKAMINAVIIGYPKQILEIEDIRELSNKTF